MSSGRKPLLLGAASLITPALAHPALAAEKAPQQADLGSFAVSDTVVVEGSYKTEKVSGNKATAPLVDTPKSITVVSRQVLEDTNSTTLAEALRTVPGITMGAGEGGNPLGDRPFLRGADSQGSIYLDGVRDLAAAARETFAIESIEVTRGSDSVTNGSGNGGGSINLVSKRPKDKRSVQVDGSLGNAKYKRATVDVNLPISDFVGVRVNGMYHYQGIAGRDAVWQKRWGIAPSIKFGLTGPTSLTLDWYHMHSNELPDQGIPYQYIATNQPSANYETAPAGTNVRKSSAFYGLVARDFRTTNTDAVTARFEHKTDGGVTLRNTARYNYTTQEYVWTQPDDSKGNVATYGTVSRRSNSRYSGQRGFVDQVDASGQFKTGALEHSFAAAAEYNWQSSYYGSFFSSAALAAMPLAGTCATATSGTNANCTSLANPNPYDAYTGSIYRGPANSQTLANSTSISASLFDTITLGEHWKLNIGGRYDHYVTNASAALAAPYVVGALTTATPATVIGSRTWQQVKNNLWTYQAGLMYKPTSNGTFYISTGTSAVPPGSFLGQGSEDNAVASATIDPNSLKVQHTTSYEIGTKWNLLNDNLALSFDVFQTKTTNARATDPDTNLPVFVGTKRVRGFEFSISGNITPKWSVFGGYSYMPSKVLNTVLTRTAVTPATTPATYAYAPAATVGKPFPNTPEHSATLFTTYKVTPRFTLGGGMMYMAKVYGGFSDTRTASSNGTVTITGTRATYVPAYVRFDANAAFRVNRNLSLRVSALNITNKLYYDQAYSTHYAHQAAGRTVLGSLSLKY